VKPFYTITDLIEWLTDSQIDTTLWAEGNAKSVANLWEEYASGEIYMRDDPPRRLVDVVQIYIRRGRQVLIEAEQEMENGRRRFRNQPPSEKIKPGETYLQAATRCLQEELGLPLTAVSFLPDTYRCRKETTDSLSYPGLVTEYTFHTIEAAVAGLPEEEFWRENTAVQTGDPVMRHLWIWRYERSLRDR
jgi:hypothetical protein